MVALGKRKRWSSLRARAPVRQAIDSYTSLRRIPLGLRPEDDLDGARGAWRAAGGLGESALRGGSSQPGTNAPLVGHVDPGRFDEGRCTAHTGRMALCLPESKVNSHP